MKARFVLEGSGNYFIGEQAGELGAVGCNVLEVELSFILAKSNNGSVDTEQWELDRDGMDECGVRGFRVLARHDVGTSGRLECVESMAGVTSEAA